MGTVNIKLNIITIFNQVVEFVNTVSEQECSECGDPIETEKNCEACPDFPDVPREMQTIDVKFQIIKNILDKVAERSAKLEDPELIELCERLGYTFTEPKKKDESNAG